MGRGSIPSHSVRFCRSLHHHHHGHLFLSLCLSLSVLIMFFFVGRAGGREQRRQYGGTKDWYVSGQDLRWLHLLTTTTDLLRSREVKSVV
ncbi:unnamed protein product [Brassica oleracea var. botrytis]